MKTIRVHTVRYEDKFFFGYSNDVFQPPVQILRDCNNFFCSECERSAREISPYLTTFRVRKITPMFAVYHNGPARQARGEHPIEAAPVSGMHNVCSCAPKN